MWYYLDCAAQFLQMVYVICVCIVIPFVLDVRLVDVPAGVTQEEYPSSCDCTEIRTHVPTSEGFEVTN